MQFVIDGERYEYEVQSWDKVTNVYGGGVSETVDYAMATKEIPILHGSEGLAYEFEEGLLDALLNAETVKVRLAGKQGNYDSTLREAQLERLQLTIQAYLDH